MKLEAAQLDAVIREVVARLVAADAAPTSAPAAASASTAPPPKKDCGCGCGGKGQPGPGCGTKAPAPAAPAADELALAARVVTLSDVADRLAGKRRLVVGPKAVVTPAVLDLLRASGVALERRAAAATATATRLALGIATKRIDAARLTAALQRAGVAVEPLADDCVLRVTRRVCEALGSGAGLGVVVTGRPAVAVCLANRDRAVRAASADEPAALDRAVADVGANLVACDPRRWNEAALARWLASWTARGAAPPPEVYAAALGT